MGTSIIVLFTVWYHCVFHSVKIKVIIFLLYICDLFWQTREQVAWTLSHFLSGWNSSLQAMVSGNHLDQYFLQLHCVIKYMRIVIIRRKKKVVCLFSTARANFHAAPISFFFYFFAKNFNFKLPILIFSCLDSAFLRYRNSTFDILLALKSW